MLMMQLAYSELTIFALESCIFLLIFFWVPFLQGHVETEIGQPTGLQPCTKKKCYTDWASADVAVQVAAWRHFFISLNPCWMEQGSETRDTKLHTANTSLSSRTRVKQKPLAKLLRPWRSWRWKTRNIIFFSTTNGPDEWQPKWTSSAKKFGWKAFGTRDWSPQILPYGRSPGDGAVMISHGDAGRQVETKFQAEVSWERSLGLPSLHGGLWRSPPCRGAD